MPVGPAVGQAGAGGCARHLLVHGVLNQLGVVGDARQAGVACCVCEPYAGSRCRVVQSDRVVDEGV
eukprot:1965546-Pyramimonas_sp.AAC.1